MSDVPPPAAPAPAPAYHRHAWGLPAGSIRALLALAVLGLLWLVALTPRLVAQYPTLFHKDEELPLLMIFLQILMVLILVHFFTAHGKTIGHRVSAHSPLGLPGGTMRFVLGAGYIGLCVFLFYNHADFSLPKETPLKSLLMLLVAVLLGYFAGLIISKFVHMFWGDPPPAPYQDVEAWIAMLALLGLGVIVLIHLINTGLAKEENKIPLDEVQAVVSGLIGVYFGARS